MVALEPPFPPLTGAAGARASSAYPGEAGRSEDEAAPSPAEAPFPAPADEASAGSGEGGAIPGKEPFRFSSLLCRVASSGGLSLVCVKISERLLAVEKRPAAALFKENAGRAQGK